MSLIGRWNVVEIENSMAQRGKLGGNELLLNIFDSNFLSSPILIGIIVVLALGFLAWKVISRTLRKVLSFVFAAATIIKFINVLAIFQHH